MDEYIKVVMQDLSDPAYGLTEEEKRQVLAEMIKAEEDYQDLVQAGLDDWMAEEVVTYMILGYSMDAAIDKACERRRK